MTSGASLRALELFERALDLDVAERAGFLARECAQDSELRRYVDRLFEADSKAGFLEIEREPPPAAIAGKVVGPFRILRTIGRGGMGVVYEAEQDYPSRRVALKMLPSGLGERRDERRFRSEIQLLARLDHPGVARVLEAGVHRGEDGAEQPYYAMEFVDGARDLLTWGRDRGLRERLALFAEVCDAVQHGHQQGVVHRDLKPANVLVGAGDVAKVIDFGVARAIDDEASPLSRATRTGEIVGTLHYMAPEQLEGAGHADTRTDVYALGLLLYELASGRPPFDFQGRVLTDVVRIIRDESPRPLGEISPDVPLDVGWVAMRALEKEPARRYASASELAADLRRFLDNRPVEAGPPSRLYALRKLVRRNRWTASAVALVLASVAAATGVSLAAMVRANDEAQKFRSINGVLTGMFVSMQVDEGGADVKAADLLDRAAERIDGFSDRPDLEAPLRRTLARCYASLALHLHAVEQAERGLALAEALTPAEEVGLAYTLGKSFLSLDRLEDAREVVDRYPVDVLERRAGVGAPERLAMRQLDADLLAREGRAAEALARLEQLAQDARGALGSDSDTTSDIETSLFAALVAAERFADAERLARAQLARQEARHGSDSEATLMPRHQLARSLLRQNEHVEAVALFESLVPRYQSIYGPEHSRTLVLFNDLANAYVGLDLDAKALPILEEVVRVRETRDGPAHSQTLVAKSNLARAMAGLGDERAEDLLVNAFETRSEIFGRDDRRALQAQFDLCRFLRQARRFEEVEPLLVDLEARSREVFTDAELSLHRNIAELAQLRLGQGRFEESVELYREAWAGFRRRAGERDELTLLIGSNLAGGLMNLGRWDEAVEAYIDVLAGMRETYEPSDERICVATTNLAAAHAQRGEMKLSEQRGREALQWTLEHLPEDHPRRLKAHDGLGHHLVAMGKPEEALPLYEELMRASDLNPGLDASQRSAFRLGYARCLRAVGQHARAADEFETVIEMEHARLEGPNLEWFATLEAELEAERAVIADEAAREAAID